MSYRLLDLFCGAGGAAVGYHRAGFEVVGVDLRPQPRYPFEFVLGDALAWDHWDFDAVHASPPCQFYANLANGSHQQSIPATRDRLQVSGLPYVIENIADAGWDMRDPVRLCGSMFALNVRRHRLFETSFPMLVAPCQHGAHMKRIRAYYGKWGEVAWAPDGADPLFRGSVDDAAEDMGIDWMTWDELREAIPPAYTEMIGYQLIQHLDHKAQVA